MASQLKPQQTTIVLHHGEINALQRELAQSVNAQTVDFNSTAQLLAEQEILFLEAKKSGFDKVDSVVLRLANIAEFLQLANPEQSLEEKYQAALAMKLDETDIIVRRQMISIYQAALRNSASSQTPSNQAINDWYKKNQSLYIDAPKYAFSHVYLSVDNHHLTTSNDRDLFKTLQSDFSTINYSDRSAIPRNNPSNDHISAAIALGDVFYGGHHFNLQSEHSIAKRFGQSFSDQLAKLTLQSWSEPIESAFGQHFIWLNEKKNSTLKPLDEVKRQIINTLNRQYTLERYNETISDLKTGYRVLIEDETGIQTVLMLNALKNNND
tara:strand:+ start:424 stop:1395 length:972 start_codon:yes stop_codon:yes gene_type:complete